MPYLRQVYWMSLKLHSPAFLFEPGVVRFHFLPMWLVTMNKPYSKFPRQCIIKMRFLLRFIFCVSVSHRWRCNCTRVRMQPFILPCSHYPKPIDKSNRLIAYFLLEIPHKKYAYIITGSINSVQMNFKCTSSVNLLSFTLESCLNIAYVSDISLFILKGYICSHFGWLLVLHCFE